MNRVLLAVVVGLSLVGCATSVEDPIVQPPEPEPATAPPTKAFSTQIDTTEGETASPYDHVPALQRPPIPIERERMPSIEPPPAPELER